MRYQRLDLNLLTALRALLAERNVTRAAEALHVTQPAMSGMLARLREHFGDPLITPVGRRMELTPLGESLAGQVGDLMQRLDAMLATSPAFDPASARRSFSIVASDYVIEVLMADVIDDVHTLAPGVTIEFRQPSDATAALLDNGDVDFVISPEHFAAQGQATQRLFDDGYRLIVARERSDIGARVSLDEYRRLHHVQMANAGRPQFEAWFEREHGALPGVAVVLNNFSQLPRFVAGSMRVATLHARMAAQVEARWPVRGVALDFEVPRLVELLQWHRYRDGDPGMAWLRERIVSRALVLPAGG
ncbi:LysR family transcriptional regulator [Derxia gummosa]|uniref:LysR family transcriptional regulator n=1 Tax=Derxia gummosa DSM 723 TaxID=1121388 RepID=A0A8B6X442_9BURK|nr:LysR family transcriptional regulator [Derxia gummosa]